MISIRPTAFEKADASTGSSAAVTDLEVPQSERSKEDWYGTINGCKSARIILLVKRSFLRS